MKREKMCIDTQFDRLERMLRWLIVRKEIDYLSHDLEYNEYRDEYRKPILDEMFKLGEHLPDIDDIVKKEEVEGWRSNKKEKKK